MFDFAEKTAGMTAAEILNYYRNLYYTEPQVTERGIVANAINDYFKEVAPRSEVARNIFCDIKEHAWQELDFAGTHWEIEDETLKELERKYMDGQTADVVLRSDIAREIFADIDKIIEQISPVYFVDAPVTHYYKLVTSLEEIKKKYTEDQT